MSSAADRPPIVWSIAGLDTAGGAGLSADQRATDAFGVHLCPVAAALTAQHSLGVDAVFAVPTAQLQAQLQALSQDLPPVAIKTGLLGSVQAVEAVARWVDHWRAQTPAGQDPHRRLALVLDPVLSASAGGQGLSNEAIVQAYRTHLLPRATVLTPNRGEAMALVGSAHVNHSSLPELAATLHAMGARAVMITGGDAEINTSATAPFDARYSIDWLHTPHAQGWLTAPRVDTRHNHGTGCTLASGVASALALGHVEADACVLAKMLTHHALMHGHAAGGGAGPVMACKGFAAGWQNGGAPLPMLGLGEALPWALTHSQSSHRTTEPGHEAHGAEASAVSPLFLPFTPPRNRLYGIVPTADQLQATLNAGVNCVQLRHKDKVGLLEQLHASLGMAARKDVQVFINDHWQECLDAIEARGTPSEMSRVGQIGLHLGQEDLLALSPPDQARLLHARSHVMLGLSSHSPWELARAAGCGPSYIACGPVQATTTKDMPWRPQGAQNLSWWVNNSPVPVVGIGGLLTPADLTSFAPCQAAALCVVRALSEATAPLSAVVRALGQAATCAAIGHQGTRSKPDQQGLKALPTPVL